VIALKADLTQIQQRLEQEFQELAARAEQIENRLRQPGDVDWEEQATQRENDEVLESLNKQTRREMEQIKHALHQIREGKYGKCARCGKDISPARLELMPYATTCVDCG
jgi:RNA polymerase-binding protein DksA